MPGRGGGNRGGGGGRGAGGGWGAGGPGRSASSPGHLKRAAGAQSARDYAPGRTGRDAADAGTLGAAEDQGGRGLSGLLDRLLGRR